MRGIGKTLGAIVGILAGILVIMIVATAAGNAFGSTESGEMRNGTLVWLEIAAAALGLILGGVYHFLADWDLFCDGMSPLSAAIEEVKKVFETRRKEIEEAKYNSVRSGLYFSRGQDPDGGAYRELYAKTLKSFAFETEDAAAETIEKMGQVAEHDRDILQERYIDKKAKAVGGLRTAARFTGQLFLGLVRVIYALLLFLAPVLLFAGLACSIPLISIDGVGAYWLLPVFSIIIGAILMIMNAISHDWYD